MKLKARFGQTKNPQMAIESAVFNRIGEREATSEFIAKEANAYEAAEFTEEQKIVFLCRLPLMTEEIRQLVILHAPSTFSKLINTLHEYEQSERYVFRRGPIFLHGAKQHNYLVNCWKTKTDEVTGRKSDVNSEVDALTTWLAELSLIMYKAKVTDMDDKQGSAMIPEYSITRGIKSPCRSAYAVSLPNAMGPIAGKRNGLG